MSADESKDIFRALPKVATLLSCLSDLGVGYLQLGQGSNTLSGGEAQRLKLAAELTASTRHEPTLYVLDEPTTGLHLGDVSKLIAFLRRLVDRGDTLVVIEHHPSVIASAERVVELGPEGGEAGGSIVAELPLQEVARLKTATGRLLKSVFSAEELARKATWGRCAGDACSAAPCVAMPLSEPMSHIGGKRCSHEPDSHRPGSLAARPEAAS